MIHNRDEFEKYILEMLGAPVVKVNITQQQLNNVINDALQYFTIYHYEGTKHTYYPVVITPTILKVTDPNTNGIPGGTIIEGVTSHAKSKIAFFNSTVARGKPSNGVLYCEQTFGEFIKGEQIKVGDKLMTVSSDDDYFKLGIIDSHKIEMPDWIVGVTRILPSSQALNSQNLFDLQYQLRLNDFTATQITTQSLIYFEQAMEHISLLNFELTAKPEFDWNYYDGVLYPRVSWGYDFCVGDFMIVEGYRSHDFEGQSRVFNEIWLKQYAVALAKKCYSQNLKKYQNVQLPGGVTFNADQMYQEAQTEIDKLENQLQSLSWPSAFMIG